MKFIRTRHGLSNTSKETFLGDIWFEVFNLDGEHLDGVSLHFGNPKLLGHVDAEIAIDENS